jgi:hypothetical protein
MTTFVTVLAAAAVAFPLVVLALRGTRADLIRSRADRRAPDAGYRLGAPDPRDTDAVRAARDLAAVADRTASATRGADARPADVRPAAGSHYLAEVSPAGGPMGVAGRSIHLTGSSSGTKPNLA